MASNCAVSALSAPSLRAIEPPGGTSPCRKPRPNRNGEPAGMMEVPDVSLRVRLVTPLGMRGVGVVASNHGCMTSSPVAAKDICVRGYRYDRDQAVLSE